jgi:hypothetical protein
MITPYKNIGRVLCDLSTIISNLATANFKQSLVSLTGAGLFYCLKQRPLYTSLLSDTVAFFMSFTWDTARSKGLFGAIV